MPLLPMMPRQLRIEFPGSFYHVMARGNRRAAIFRDDQDRRTFLESLGQACARTGWRVHAWVLMGNHYHLLLEPGNSGQDKNLDTSHASVARWPA